MQKMRNKNNNKENQLKDVLHSIFNLIQENIMTCGISFVWVSEYFKINTIQFKM